MSTRLKWFLAAGTGLFLIGFIRLFGPPGLVDVSGYQEVESGVIEVSLLCHNDVTSHVVWSFEGSMWLFAFGTDPDRYSFGRDACLSHARIDLGEPIGSRRLVDGFDLSTVPPHP